MLLKKETLQRRTRPYFPLPRLTICCVLLFIFSFEFRWTHPLITFSCHAFFGIQKLNHAIELSEFSICFFHFIYHERRMGTAISLLCTPAFLVFFQSDGQKIAFRCVLLHFSDSGKVQALSNVFWRFVFSPL